MAGAREASLQRDGASLRAALESRQCFSRALRGSDPEEARRADHTSRRTGYLVEFTFYGTWAHFCHSDAGSR